tara:strand:- start:8004 stop:9353 length:1350 start_codon:yes stop_codon:yes gene_type:complete
MPKSITISDATILDFYEKNPHIDIVSMNLLFIDILKKLGSDLSKSVSDSKLAELEGIVKSMKEGFPKEIKSLLNSSSIENVDRVNSLLERNTSAIMDKTTNILNDVIPKNQGVYQKQIEGTIREFYQSLSSDTKRILELKEKEGTSVKDIQQPIFSFISACEERTNSKIEALKESSSVQALEQEKMGGHIMEFLNKYKHSTTTKGSISENILYGILQNIYPSDEIVDCRSATASGDFIVNRKDSNRPTIMFENKDYKLSVDTREVGKFERDIQAKKCHGIFLSQSSPITFKECYQIDIIDGLIHVYVPNAEFNLEKIKIAADIVDRLAPALKMVEDEYTPDNISISMNEIERITEEYKAFATKRGEMIDYIKLTSKQMLDNMDEFTLPSLNSMLVSAGKMDSTNSLVCPFCKKYTGKSKQSLAAHTRKCKMNPKSPLFESPIGEITIST